MSANASETLLGFLREASLGVLPSPAAFKLLRFVSEDLDIQRENVESAEIRPDRNVSDIIQVGGSAGGSANFEFSDATFDEILESVMFNAWSGSPADSLVNGVTQKSFHIQKKFEAGGTDVFYLMKGMVADSLSLNFAAKQIVTGNVSFVGLGGTVSNAATGTDTPANTEPVMNASSHFTLSDCGVSPAPSLLSLSLNINNNLAGRPRVGSVDNIGIRSGRCKVSGSFTAYFASKALADMFLAGNAGALAYTIGADSNKKYTFTIPSFKILTQRVAAGGNDQDVMYVCEFQGMYDAGIGGTLKIERNVA